MFTMRNPHQFKYSINLSGYFQPQFDNGKTLLAPGDTQYDLDKIASEEKPNVDIWYWAAKDDKMPVQQLEQFKPHVSAPTTLVTNLIANGGHSWPVWTSGLQHSIEWLGSPSPQFAWEQA